MPVCKKCGKEFDDYLNTCPFCGEPHVPELPEEDFDMYEELQSSSDTKEFMMPDEIIEEAAAPEPAPAPAPQRVPGEDEVFQTSSILIADIREKLVQEMYTAEEEEPSFLEKMKSSASSFLSSLRKPRRTERPAEQPEEAEKDTDEEIPETEEQEIPDEEVIPETSEVTEGPEAEETAAGPEEPEDGSSVPDASETDEVPETSLLFDELKDEEPSEEEPVLPESEEEQPEEIPAEETEQPDEQNALDTLLLSLRERVDKKQSAEEAETAQGPSEGPAPEETAAEEETEASEDETQAEQEKEKPAGPAADSSKLLRKKGLGRGWVLALALMAILAVAGVVFLYILPQKQAEQQAIEDRENAYLDFLCDKWMSDVFIYTEQEHPSREVLTLNRDYTYRCDIWTSSSDREAFDPEIWSVTDTLEGTYYLELDTASLRIYYTGDDGENYVYRRYIRELDGDTLVLREYYNETLSDYYDVTFTKYKEG